MAADLSGRYSCGGCCGCRVTSSTARMIGGLVMKTSFGAGLAILLSDRAAVAVAAVLTMTPALA